MGVAFPVKSVEELQEADGRGVGLLQLVVRHKGDERVVEVQREFGHHCVVELEQKLEQYEPGDGRAPTRAEGEEERRPGWFYNGTGVQGVEPVFQQFTGALQVQQHFK